MCGYGFMENEDYSGFSQKSDKPQGGRPTIEHILTLRYGKAYRYDPAHPAGQRIRDKLISLETRVQELSPELRLLINLEMRQKEQDRAIAEVNQRVDDIKDVVALTHGHGARRLASLIVRTAQSMGGNEFIRDVQAEIFALVDERPVSALQPASPTSAAAWQMKAFAKSKRDKLNRVDVIADDKKLIEIYLAVVKEMAVQRGAKIA